jgi:hypothetical protein
MSLLLFYKTSTGPSSPSKLWIRVSGVWKETTTHIKVAGTWKVATVFIKDSGVWK